MSADRNWLTIGGDQMGRTLTPADFPSEYFNEEGWLTPPDPRNWSDTLKLGGLKNCILSGWKIIGSSEDCVDMTHCDNVSFFNCSCIPTGSRVLTIKDSVNCHPEFEVLAKPNKHDVVAGQYVINGNRKTVDWTLKLVCYPSRNATCELWNANPPRVLYGSSHIEIEQINPIIVKVWIFLRGLWDKLFA